MSAAAPLPEGAAQAALRSERFRIEREADWRRLETILAEMEKGRLRRISDADLMALPALYRTAASSLAVAREISLEEAMLDYLEGLVQRAWFQVYGPRSGAVAWFRNFLRTGWPGAVRAMWLDLCIALAMMVVGAVSGWLLVARNSDWYHALVPQQFAETRVPGASRDVLAQSLGTADGAGGLTAFAGILFTNNARVAILAFALGFVFGLPSAMLLIHNMAVLGAMLWLFSEAGLGFEFAAWLSVHGTTELLAILLAGAAGIHIGRSMAFPGSRSVLESARESGRRAAVVMVGVVLMMMAAALLEAFARQLLGTGGRLALGTIMLAAWIGYFGWAGRARGATPR